MIRRDHQGDGRHSYALYSDCEGYRYRLTRRWNPDGQELLFIMLNPSKATEAQNDPTIERCERRARALGYGGLSVCNLFAWRETDPALLKKAKSPEGSENRDQIEIAAQEADCILCGWGVHGEFLQMGRKLAADLMARGFTLHALDLTKEGHPKHPLYIRYAELPKVWHDPYNEGSVQETRLAKEREGR